MKPDSKIVIIIDPPWEETDSKLRQILLIPTEVVQDFSQSLQTYCGSFYFNIQRTSCHVTYFLQYQLVIQ
jgi:hypothetical protein